VAILVLLVIAGLAALVGIGVLWNKGWRFGAIAAPLGAFAIVWLACSISIVDAGNQKVQTSFGKVTGVNEAGLNLVDPWSSGTSFSTRQQWVEFKDDPKCGDCEDEPWVDVRLAGQATAKVFGIIEYTQPASSIDDLFLTWKSEERIRSVYVYTKAKGALNAAFGQYDPLATVKLQDDVFGTYGKLATDKLQAAIGEVLPGIKITVTGLDLDDKTEDQLRGVQAAIAQTRIAEQGALTAAQIALANKTIAASLSSDPVAAFYQCSAMWTTVLKEIKPQNLNVSAICSAAVPTFR